ncbi:MAG: peptide chain release factor N(5)-glutamine methyltransferase [Firmicutes bacterium]|nr:peptide chain release factor N(5)-glutamine methyltransferase [Bacillota bacterium]
MTDERSNIGNILAKTIPFLAGKGIINPRLEADLLLAKILGLPRVKLYSQWDRELTPAELENYREIIRKRIQGWPNAYLTGKKAFLSWEFDVTPAVLIPRPETELLVEVVVGWVNQQPQNRPQEGFFPQPGQSGESEALNLSEEQTQPTVQNPPELRGLDVGTGSGIIAISLAKLLPQSVWDAVDISEAALEIARQNADKLKVAGRIRFQSGNLMEPYNSEALNRQFDLIVANLPYVPTAETGSLSAEVQKEPLQALDGGPDGLELYRKLLPQAVPLLANNGIIALEHGHDQRLPLEEMAAGLGLSCTSFADLSGYDRVLLCQRKK